MSQNAAINNSVRGAEDAENFYNEFSEHERGFCLEMLSFIKTDPFLSDFYNRFILECNNIGKVIDKVGGAENAGARRLLTRLIEKFDSAKSPGEFAMIDSLFHIELFEITCDTSTADELRKEATEVREKTDNSEGLHGKLWTSISRDPNHKDMLINSHREILTSLENRDHKSAITAIQKHFAVVLTHYTQRLHVPRQKKV